MSENIWCLDLSYMEAEFYGFLASIPESALLSFFYMAQSQLPSIHDLAFSVPTSIQDQSKILSVLLVANLPGLPMIYGTCVR